MMDNFDNEIQEQMTITDLYNPPEKLFAVSRIFARARKMMTLAEQKTFVYALTQLRFTEEATTDCVTLDKKTLAAALGINSDPDHLSVDLYNEIKKLPEHSYIEINKKDIGLQSNGFVITAVTRLRNTVRVRFNPEYMGLFTGLTDNYIAMWSADIFQMKTKRGVQFYEELRQRTRTETGTNCEGYGVRQLKELFDIPETGEGSYMRPKEQGGFNRANFEKYVIDAICEDMRNCKMIQLITQPDGKFYEKVKNGKRVMGYRFYWTYSSRPGIATAEQMQEIREVIDKNPQVLKVARDIVEGKKKPKQKKTTFTNFEQRSYDYDELEARLLRMRKGDQ
jgi:hypothetical protein